MGCVDTIGNFHDIETTWTMPDDACQQCKCISDQNTLCTARKCPDLVKPVCMGGAEPSLVADITGCCSYYVCDCK